MDWRWDIRCAVVSIDVWSCGVARVAQTEADGGGQQVLSALHIWSDGQLIKHVEEAFLTIAAP